MNVISEEVAQIKGGKMVECFRKVTVLVITAILLVGCAKELSLDEIVEKVKEKYAGIEDYQAVYTQNMTVMGKEMVLEGKVFSKGDNMRMDLSTVIPGQDVSMDQLVIYDGKVVWAYNSMMNVVHKVEMFRLPEKVQEKIKEEQKIGAWIPKFKGEIALIKGKDFYVIETKEKPESQPGQFFPKILYYIGKDDFLLHRIEFYTDDKLGATIEFKDIQLNSGISDDKFVFEISEDVQVIDMTDNVLKMIKE